MADGSFRWGTTRRDPWSAVARREGALWAVALASLVLDGLLTGYGLSMGFAEANPVAAALVAHVGPVPAFTALKGAALLVALAGRRAIPGRYAAVVPLALALPWSVGVAVNAVVLAGA